MSDSAFNLGSSHPVRIDATDDAPLVLLNKGDTIYLGQQPNVSASNAAQTLASGQQITLNIPTWAISASSSHVLVSNPVAKLTQTLTTIVNQVIDQTTIQQIIQQIDPAVLSGIQGQFDTANGRLSADENDISGLQDAVATLNTSLDDTLLPGIVSTAPTQSITNGGSAQVINFTATSINVGGYVLTLGPPATFTIPSTGWYSGKFTGQFAFAAGGIRILQGKLNNTVFDEAHMDPSADTNQATKHRLVWGPEYFTGGDTLKFLAYQTATGGGALNLSSPRLTMVKHKHVGQSGGASGGGSGGGTGTFSAIGSGTLAANAWYPNSIFKTPIASLPAAGQVVHPNSANIIASIFSRGPAAAGGKHATIVGYSGLGNVSGSDFSHPIYKATSGDVTITLTTNNYHNTDLDGLTIKVPANAKWSNGSDGSMGVIQPVDGNGDTYEIDFWGIVAAQTNIANGQLTCGFARRNKLNDTGTNQSSANDRGGITAARFSHGLGVVRVDELTSNYGGGSLTTIDHALFVAVNQWHGRVGPANTSGGTSGQINTDPNAPAMGQHLRVKASYDVAASGLPLWHKRIMKALQTYGAYIGDTGGASLNFQLESEMPYLAAHVTPTCLNYLDTTTSHTPGTIYDIDAGVSWATILEVLNPPS